MTAAVDSQQSKTRDISITLEKIQNFDAKIAFENWKKLGTDKK